MKVVVKEPGKPARIENVMSDLKSLQEIVGGWIETVRVAKHVLMVCNEQGKLIGLPENFVLGRDHIVGTVFFAGYSPYDFCDLTDAQADAVMAWLRGICDGDR